MWVCPMPYYCPATPRSGGAVDIIAEKVAMLNSKQSPIIDTEIEQFLREKTLNFQATQDIVKSLYWRTICDCGDPTDYDLKPTSLIPSQWNQSFDVQKINPAATIIVEIHHSGWLY
ncbi:hypothetical protein I3679_023300 [Proteus mirabilis]|uniref:Uncharacterized protein n=1 Tax=Proteus mirabilis TaxID=584 RepID=A0ABD5M125_PROMI